MSVMTYGETKEEALRALEAVYKSITMLEEMHADTCTVAQDSLENENSLKQELTKAENTINDQREHIRQLSAELDRQKQAKEHYKSQVPLALERYKELGQLKRSVANLKAIIAEKDERIKQLESQLKDQRKHAHASDECGCSHGCKGCGGNCNDGHRAAKEDVFEAASGVYDAGDVLVKGLSDFEELAACLINALI